MVSLSDALIDLVAAGKRLGGLEGEGKVWDVLAALRGPDSPDDVEERQLKFLTTCRIRSLLLKGFDTTIDEVKGLTHRSAIGFVNHSELTDTEIETRNELLVTCSDHFRQHFYAAMEALRKLEYPVPKKELWG